VETPTTERLSPIEKLQRWSELLAITTAGSRSRVLHSDATSNGPLPYLRAGYVKIFGGKRTTNGVGNAQFDKQRLGRMYVSL
jgi:hypothetical protein